MRCMGFDEVDVEIRVRWRLCRCGTRAVHRLFLSFDGSIVVLVLPYCSVHGGVDGVAVEAEERELNSKSILLYRERERQHDQEKWYKSEGKEQRHEGSYNKS
jgi:hypothetical protein